MMVVVTSRMSGMPGTPCSRSDRYACREVLTSAIGLQRLKIGALEADAVDDGEYRMNLPRGSVRPSTNRFRGRFTTYLSVGCSRIDLTVPRSQRDGRHEMKRIVRQLDASKTTAAGFGQRPEQFFSSEDRCAIQAPQLALGS